jgi:NitT/TauT family transport system permease protein
MKLREKLAPFYFAAGLVVIWQLVVQYFKIPTFILPLPTMIVTKIFTDFNQFIYNSGITLLESVIGFIIANILGFSVAVICVYSRSVEKGIFPLAIALKTTPIVAIAPLLVIWLGTDIWSKIMASALVCFFPIMVNSVKGLKSVEYEAKELFDIYKASGFEMFLRLRLPSSMSYIMAALKISSSLAVVGAIVGEFVGSSKGLGYLVVISSYHMDTPTLFAAIIGSALIGILLYAVVGFFEKKFVFWNKEEEI